MTPVARYDVGATKHPQHRLQGQRELLFAEVNGIIARLDDQKPVFYMDIGPRFLDEKGAFLPDAFRPDNLHPQARGYDIWGDAVLPKLSELLK